MFAAILFFLKLSFFNCKHVFQVADWKMVSFSDFFVKVGQQSQKI